MSVHALPDFPWDSLAPYKERAGAVPGGIVDLSVGTPVDPTPGVIREALCEASDAPGYPQSWGTADLREAVVAWFGRRRGAPGVDPDGVLPTIGSKEFVAWLPTLMGLGAGDVVGIPSVAYPTYAVGAQLAGAQARVVDGLAALGPVTPRTAPRLLWLNSPGNPDGKVLGVEHLAKVVDWARRNDVVVASDECYAELDWREAAEPARTTPSILDPRVCDGDHTGLLAVYSLSKQSNLAGYRAAFAAGDPALVRRILQVRRHAGMVMPWAVQRALLAALGDDDHVRVQRERYAARRAALLPALEGFGLRIDTSEAGLYLWGTLGEDALTTVGRFADRGILVAPGSFYGAAGREHVRVALTSTDERVAAAVERLSA